MKLKLRFLLIIVCLLFITQPLHAADFTWLFYDDPHDYGADGREKVGIQKTYFSDSWGILVKGFEPLGTPIPGTINPDNPDGSLSEELTEHNRNSGKDLGLGISGGTTTKELDGNELLLLNLGDNWNNYTWEVKFSSVDGEEVAQLHTNSSEVSDDSFIFSNSPAASYDAGDDPDNPNFPTSGWISFNANQYLYFTEGGYSSDCFSNDVLLTGLQATVIPEPATMLLFGFGLIGLAGTRRKLKKNS